MKFVDDDDDAFNIMQWHKCKNVNTV